MEIERKFLIKELPSNIEEYAYHDIEQAYLSTNPVVRVRKEDDTYYLTYKGSGMLARREENLPLTEESYLHLKKKADGNVISKRRYLIPLTNPSFEEGYEFKGKELLIELDVFRAPFDSLIMAEIEFESVEDAEHFQMPDWFKEDVTYDKTYHNSNMSTRQF